MKSENKCPQCQGELPGDLLMGLCPNCVGRVVFQFTGDSPRETPDGVQRRWFGHYELLEIIGRGGMGVVWRARQLGLNRLVALKTILTGQLANNEEAERFQREAQNAASLDHSNIVGIYDVGEHQGQPYFSMRWVEGVSLGQWLQKRQRQLAQREPVEACAPLDSPRAAARLIATVARAVHHAHQRGIIHRDLKPGNILLDAQGEPQITDFGLAKRVDLPADLTRSETVLGTPHYMSPEQAQGKNQALTTATDVYSLGAILYHLLCGQPVFPADTAWKTLRATVEQPPIRPGSIRRGVDRDLETICLKCLEKDPRRRYASADALAEDLDRWQRHEPVQARRCGTLELVRKWTRRHSAIATLMILLVLSLLAGVTGIIWEMRQAVMERRKAQAAERRAMDKLWASYLAQAQANRWSHQPGQRFASFAALSNAAAIHPSLELRNEALAALALPDVRIQREWRLDPPVPLFNGLVFNATHDLYARAYYPGEVSICRARDDAELFRLPGLGQRLEAALCFSPDGGFLADKYTGQFTNLFRVWDLSRRAIVLSLPWLPLELSFAFTPDSSRIAVAEGQRLHWYALPSGNELGQYATPFSPNHLRFDPTGEMLALCAVESPQLAVVESASGKVVQTFATAATSCAWNQDGSLVASGCPDKQVYLWNVKTGERQGVLQGHTAFVTDVVCGSAGDWLASHGWDDVTRFWDLETHDLLLTVPGGLIRFNPPSPDDRRLGFHINVYHAGIWQFEPAWECRRWRSDNCLQATFDSTGRVLITADVEGAHFWDAERRCLAGHLRLGATRSVILAPDAKALILGSEHGLERRAFDFDEGKGELHLGRAQCLTSAPVVAASLGTGGKLVVALGDYTSILIVDLAHPEQARVAQANAHGAGISISPDGTRFVVGNGVTQDLTVWDMASTRVLKVLPAEKTACAVFSPDGQYLVVGEIDDYRICRVDSWECVRRLQRDRVGGGAGAVVFSPDGSLLALQEGQLGRIKLLATRSWEELATIEEGWPLCFSADGSKLAVYSGESKSLMVWDLRRVRRVLAAMNLDWKTPPFSAKSSDTPENTPANHLPPIKVIQD